MSSSTIRIAGATILMALGAAPSAHAAGAVFGGSTSAREPIVLVADKAAKQVKSVVLAVTAECDGGTTFPVWGRLTVTKGAPGFTPSPSDLVVSRNARGRFAGTSAGTSSSADTRSEGVIQIAGTLKARSAAGTLSLEVTRFDSQSGAKVDSCRSGTVRWAASRSPGRVYGGSSSEDEPVVVRLDAKRKKVSDILAGWESTSCTEDGFFRIGDRMSDFPLRGGGFGDTWDESYDDGDGGRMKYAYTLAGKVAARSAKGSLSVTVSNAGADGATKWSCDTGTLTWKVATG